MYFDVLVLLYRIETMSGKTKFCVGKDALERMNYLFQLSNMCASGEIENAAAASRFYARQVVAISKKTVQRIEPAMKRKICKSCHQFLVPGKTCKIRVRKKVVIHQCLVCNSEKRFMASPNYVLWNERPEAVGELLDYRSNDTKQEENPAAKKTSMSKVVEDKMETSEETLMKVDVKDEREIKMAE